MDFGQEILALMTNENLTSDEVEFVGCSAYEIEQLKQSQQVDFIAAPYRELMLAMGRSGIECLLDGESTYDSVKDMKLHIMQLRHVGSLIPKSALFFLSILDAYFFFDTQDHVDNPAVYMVYEDAVTQSAATFTQFVDHKINLLRTEKNRQLEDDRRSVYYDPNTDSFYTKPSDE